jgi:hypothetical protein
MVFALGVVMASILVGVTVVVGVVMAGAWFLEARLGIAPNATWVMWTAMLFTLPYLAAYSVDRSMGARMAADGVGTRILRGVLKFYSVAGFGMANNPALALLSSHRGQKWTTLLMAVVFFGASTTALTSYTLAREPDAYGSYDAFPDSDEMPSRTLDPAHYDDRRDPVRSRETPYVQSAVIIGPYLQLTVPWDPDRDGPAMDGRCGSLPADQQLACYAEHIRPVTLDGKPIATAYEIGEDARTNRPALMAMVDVRALARGRHVLGVALPPRLRKKDDDPVADYIPFWR